MRFQTLVMSAAAVAFVVSAAACAAPVPVKNEPSKEAQLAMLKDEGYYAEEQKDGRYYVFGSQKTHDEFRRSGHLQISKSFIAAGPDGATVVVESKDKLPELAARLAATFGAQHGLTLK